MKLRVDPLTGLPVLAPDQQIIAVGGSGSIPAGGGGGGAVDSVNGQTGVVTLDQDDVLDGTSFKQYSSADKTKLAGIATGATANDTDANLKARANHTGTQLAATISDFSAASDARIAAASGVSIASLSGGKVPSSQLPALALTDVFTVASQVAQLALTVEEGDVAIRTDQNKSYIHNGGVSGTMADWSELLTPTDTVLSVNGETGAVTITTDDVSDAGQTNKWATAAEKTKLGFISVTQAVNLDTMESDIVLKANDSAVVHNTGNETVAGIKTFSSDIIIPDEAYGGAWDGSLEAPTKNAVYDKIQTISGGSATINQTTIDFGSAEKSDELFNIVDAGISATSKIIAFVTWVSALGRDPDEVMADPISIAVEPLAGSMNIYAMALEGTVSGKYAVNYQIG
jgi:hypothetical protein